VSRPQLLSAAIALFGGAAAPGQDTSIGLTSVRAKRFQNDFGPTFPASDRDRYGSVLAVGDFDWSITVPGSGHRGRMTMRKRFRTFALTALGFSTAVAPAAAQVTSVGLSTVRSRHLGKQPEQASPLFAGDLFAFALATGDFDGDGAADLVTGAPHADGPPGAPAVFSGWVVVRHGEIGRGLAEGERSVLSQLDFGGLEAFDLFGTALAVCDFDGDGFDDLSVGSPGEALGPTLTRAGAVAVYFGSTAGLGTEEIQIFHQDTPGIPDAAEHQDEFGGALACGDFEGDGFADLVVGAPREAIGSSPGAGAVTVLPGSATGLVAAGSFQLDQGQPLVTGEAGGDDEFGFALAVADFDGDGFDDLVVGAPGELAQRGAFHVFFGSPTGLARGDDVYREESVLGGQSEADDLFAFALAAGDFDGDGHADLVVGVPGEDGGPAGDVPESGQFAVLQGAPGGFDFDHPRFWTQDDILGSGTSETSDYFGLPLTVADFDRDGFDDLAIGSSGEFVTGPLDGAAVVLVGSATGLTAERHRGIASGLDGWPGDATEHERRFSYSLAAGDFDGDGHADLAIGAPLEDFDAQQDSGAQTVIYGALFADGFETAATDLWSGTSPRDSRTELQP
jgi:hypothetical protein